MIPRTLIPQRDGAILGRGLLDLQKREYLANTEAELREDFIVDMMDKPEPQVEYKFMF